jgi:hypothetical protein
MLVISAHARGNNAYGCNLSLQHSVTRYGLGGHAGCCLRQMYVYTVQIRHVTCHM